MSEKSVAKYGGSSMAHPEVVAGIIENHPEQQLIVVSAPGISPGYDIKMTDVLFYFGSAILGRDPSEVLPDQKLLEKIENRYGPNSGVVAGRQIANDVIEQFDFLYQGLSPQLRSTLRNTTYRQLLPRDFSSQNMAYYASRGEHMSARYLSELTGGVFRDSDFIRFQDNSLDRPGTFAAVAKAAERGLFVEGRPTVVPGFSGKDQNGTVRLLGRGGSDRTQVLIQGGLNWDGENWTDVDGVYSANPKVIGNAIVLDEANREEIREGAHGGFGIFQGDTILDLQGKPVTVTIKNTFNPSAPGTRVVADASHFQIRKIDPEHPIVAVSGRPLMELTVRDLGMADEKGYLARLLHRAEELGIVLEHIPAAQDAATFTIHAAASIEALNEFKKSVEYHTISDSPIVELKEKGVVYVVGEALGSPAVITKTLGRLGTMLSRRGLSFDAVVSHPQSPSLALLVERNDIEPVLKAIHKKFIEGSLPRRIWRKLVKKVASLS